MSWLSKYSLKREVIAWVGLNLIIFVCLLWSTCTDQTIVSSFWLTIVLMLLMLVGNLQFYRIVRSELQQVNAHINVLLHDDHQSYFRSCYRNGESAEVFDGLQQLSEKLHQQKLRYDRHVFLVYQLIEQLDTPVLILNQKRQLTFANENFSQLYQTPWQNFRYGSSELLHLTKEDGQWLFNKSELAEQWQIRHSEFVDQGVQHELLVFINISSALRDNQLRAWQQVIRVLSHEIKNSLAPVSSIAETVGDMVADTQVEKGMDAITQRCQQLTLFVDRYGDIAKPLSLNCDWHQSKVLFASLLPLFDSLTITLNVEAEYLWCDDNFLHQVMINILRNATEANADKVDITGVKHQHTVTITVTDNGDGFSHTENAFIPLYTTKPNGQGIGLSFCKRIVEQHQYRHRRGEIGLTSSPQGVAVTITLPLPMTSSKSN